MKKVLFPFTFHLDLEESRADSFPLSCHKLRLCLYAGSGELEFEEFCILAARFLIEEDEEQMRRELKEAFRFYDKDGLGYLTIETLKGILLELEPKLDDEQLMEIVEEVDEDGSGTIDFDGKVFDTVRISPLIFTILPLLFLEFMEMMMG